MYGLHQPKLSRLVESIHRLRLKADVQVKVTVEKLKTNLNIRAINRICTESFGYKYFLYSSVFKFQHSISVFLLRTGVHQG